MKRRHFLLSGLIFFLTFVGYQASAEPVTIPIWKDIDGRVRVSVTFAGDRSFDFIVDTGMMSTVIMPELVSALELSEKRATPETPKPHGAGANSTSYSSLPAVIGGKVNYLIKSPAVLSNIKISEQTVYGILGSEFLQQYTVGFDLEAGEMVLSDSGASDLVAGSTYTQVPMYSPYANLWFTQTQIDDVVVTAFIDTGASGSLINPEATSKVRPETIDLTGSRKAKLKVGTGLVDQSYSVIVSNVSAGARTWKNKEMMVSAGIFAQLRLANKPAMLMGPDLLLARRLIMDYPNNLVYFEVIKDEAI